MFISLENLFFILVAYIAFIKYGTLYMKNKQPFPLMIPMLIYNIVQLLMNLHLFYMSYLLLGLRVFSFWSDECYPVTAANLVVNVKDEILIITYFCTVNKIFDLCETVFYVLMKKREKVTTLHVYHHISTLTLAILMDRLDSREEILMKILAINTIGNSVMQLHFLLTGINLTYQKLIFMKKFVTVTLTVEVTMSLIMVVRLLLYCNVPLFFTIIWMIHLTTLIVLFVKHYNTAYIKNRNQ
ncbi:unnamed protein product [Nezara viridula]|uniref:Elongation of very long chain fatty acids protein n=1 Tax=Nezara viridula TaxID=85310 RepID=A0A9P0H7I4_NEZVI|nr:unnamed protein product [Nezara viridula]